MRKFLLSLVAAAIVIPATMAVPTTQADARKRYYSHSNRHYATRCRRSSGTTGLVAGGVGGALLGNAVGGGVLGTVAGGVGGALGGRAIDRSMTARRRGC